MRKTVYLILILSVLCQAVFSLYVFAFSEIKITGKAANMPFSPNSFDKADFSIDVSGPKSSGWFKYYLKQIRRGFKPLELRFESNSITEVSLTENQATITGTGIITGGGTYAFRATIIDENPDKFALILYTQEGKIYLDVKLSNVVEGDSAITAT